MMVVASDADTSTLLRAMLCSMLGSAGPTSVKMTFCAPHIAVAIPTTPCPEPAGLRCK